MPKKSNSICNISVNEFAWDRKQKFGKWLIIIIIIINYYLQ